VVNEKNRGCVPEREEEEGCAEEDAWPLVMNWEA
jgi:hypothetical protein